MKTAIWMVPCVEREEDVFLRRIRGMAEVYAILVRRSSCLKKVVVLGYIDPENFSAWSQLNWLVRWCRWCRHSICNEVTMVRNWVFRCESRFRDCCYGNKNSFALRMQSHNLQNHLIVRFPFFRAPPYSRRKRVCRESKCVVSNFVCDFTPKFWFSQISHLNLQVPSPKMDSRIELI